jgi:hypothetical protein
MGERKRASKIQWRVIRLRSRGEYLGTVTVPDEGAAVKAALKLFPLRADEAKRLLGRRYR